jgi:hypothetical protein
MNFFVSVICFYAEYNLLSTRYFILQKKIYTQVDIENVYKTEWEY